MALTEAQMKKFRAILEERRQSLITQARKTLESDMVLSPDDRFDEVDQASSEYMQAFSFRLRGREKFLMDKLELALRKIDDLIGLKSRDAYQQVADLLSDLKEALACTDQSDLARTQARELKKKYPSRQILHTTLKQAGLLGK